MRKNEPNYCTIEKKVVILCPILIESVPLEKNGRFADL